jgi:O-succinylbenzoate synthase
MSHTPTLHLICGQAGAGKTTYAKHLEKSESAVRFSKDEWIVTLYGRDLTLADWSQFEPRCYALIESLSEPLLKRGIDVIWDYGFWYREERLRALNFANNLEALGEEVKSYVDAGYRRIKLKIEPGWDIEAVKYIRNLYPDIPLQVDANQAYSRNDGKHLAKLDEFNLLLIEQPLDEHDILGHALLAKEVKTAICLDESIISLQSAEDALALKATTIINIKPGRVGGYLESVKIHDLCLKNKIPVWCGGMLETGIGRAANLALAALPGFTLPGDTSASARYFKQDVTTPFVMDDGYLTVPTGPGIGVEPDLDFLDEITTAKELI